MPLRGSERELYGVQMREMGSYSSFALVLHPNRGEESLGELLL